MSTMTREERAARRCDWCDEPIGVTAKVGARFCSDRHKSRWHNRERKQKTAESQAVEAATAPATLLSTDKRFQAVSGREPKPADRSRGHKNTRNELDRPDVRLRVDLNASPAEVQARFEAAREAKLRKRAKREARR